MNIESWVLCIPGKHFIPELQPRLILYSQSSVLSIIPVIHSFSSLSRSVAEKEAVANFTNQKTISHPPDMSGWNPFGEDNFSKLTEEELLDREFDLLRSSKGHLKAYFASQ